MRAGLRAWLRDARAGVLVALASVLCFAVAVLVPSPARAQGGPPPPVAPIVGEWAFQFGEGELLVSSGPHIRCYGSPLDDWRTWVEAPNCFGDPYGTEAEPSVYPCDGAYLELDPGLYNGGGCWTFGLTESQAQCVMDPVYNADDYSFTWGPECAVYTDPGTDPEPPTEAADLAAVAAAASAAAQAAADAAEAAAGLRADFVIAFWCACAGLGFFGYSVGARDA